jgi:hypothetical protein
LEEESWPSRQQAPWRARAPRERWRTAPYTQSTTISWLGTTIVIIGFVIGGVAFPIANPGPNWVLFWVGAGVAIIGCLILAFSKAMNTDWY